MSSISTSFARLLLASSLFVVATAATTAHAVSFSDLSNQDASTGLKAALDKGSAAAVSKLGVDGGFLNNDKVKIQLPSILEKARPILQMTGKGQQLDELVVSMNRAAEAAVPMAKPLLVNAVKSMTLTDAKNILTGGETSVTDFFKEKTSAPLSAKFLPMVKGVTDKAGLSAKYNGIMSQAQKFGAVSQQEATVEGYVTQKAMDALFLMIAEEEKSIRQDPLGAGSKAISKVFSLLK
ncbi:DUF4197 domain-containing protein [Undibacterium sp. JH2W]|uniref:DUF4197 domain-containing protein n=1 Tax=Undibacterium sp. JH2W TaxID=3413037 RepID=UPI003BF38619